MHILVKICCPCRCGPESFDRYQDLLYCITANVVSACIDIPILIIVTEMHLYNPWWFRY